MKIFWYGKTSFEIVSKEKSAEPISIIIDPISKDYPKRDNNILILTHNLDYNRKSKAFIVSKAGEYEVNEVFIQGIPLKDNSLIFIIKVNGVKMCHLGNTDIVELGEEQVKELGLIDILFIDGGEVDKTKIIKQLEPIMIIPMNYENVDLFLKRLGESNKETLDYLRVRKRDVEGKEEAEVIVLNKKGK